MANTQLTWPAAGAAMMAAMIVATPTAMSHPHAWIDIRVDVLFDEDGNATGLRQHWMFDEFYTAFALETLGSRDRTAPSQAEMDEIVHQNVSNLAAYDYFTDVTQGDVEVAFGEATGHAAAMRDLRLEMTFVVPFSQALDLTDLPLGYAVYDPTYYIEMLHADIDEPVTLEAAPTGCTHEIISPNPSFEAVSLAAALDIDQTVGDGLGELFAEQVVVKCG